MSQSWSPFFCEFHILLTRTHHPGCDYDLCLNCMGEHAEFPASIASDGRFLYVSDAEHRSLLKIGSGREGTVEGKVYAYIAGGGALRESVFF